MLKQVAAGALIAAIALGPAASRAQVGIARQVTARSIPSAATAPLPAIPLSRL